MPTAVPLEAESALPGISALAPRKAKVIENRGDRATAAGRTVPSLNGNTMEASLRAPLHPAGRILPQPDRNSLCITDYSNGLR